MRIDTSNSRAYLSPYDAETFWSTAPKATELVTRLQALSSPRIGKAVSLRRRDVRIPDAPSVEIPIVEITDAKDTREDGDGQHRYSWVPRSLYDDLEDWCEREGIAPGEEIIPGGVSKHQKAIRRTRQRIADDTGSEIWEDYPTSHDFRIYFATNSFRRLGLDLDVVMRMGGWESRRAVEPYIEQLLPVDIQNRLLEADAYEFTDQRVPEVDVAGHRDRFDTPDYDAPEVDADLDRFLG